MKRKKTYAFSLILNGQEKGIGLDSSFSRE